MWFFFGISPNNPPKDVARQSDMLMLPPCSRWHWGLAMKMPEGGKRPPVRYPFGETHSPMAVKREGIHEYVIKIPWIFHVCSHDIPWIFHVCDTMIFPLHPMNVPRFSPIICHTAVPPPATALQFLKLMLLPAPGRQNPGRMEIFNDERGQRIGRSNFQKKTKRERLAVIHSQI
jgi:hypothetical protein